MFDIFTGPAKQAILLAQDEAIGLGHDYIGTEDLLVGLAGTSSPDRCGAPGAAIPLDCHPRFIPPR